jgi:hypothetical protein
VADFELRADYDHDGRLTGSQTEYEARGIGPGALLVANADADRRAFPASVTVGPPVPLDFTRYVPSPADDEIIPLVVRVNNPAVAAGRTFGVRVPGIHGVRVRFYDDTGQILRTDRSNIPGEHSIRLAGVSGLDLLLETRSYPGSPFGRAMLFGTSYDPSADTEDQSAFVMELFSRDSAGIETIHDRGHFSVPPVLLLDNGASASRLYICDTPGTVAAISDTRAALAGILGVHLIPVPENVCGGDTWLQDQFQPGIVVGSDRWRHVIVHLPRTRADFVGRNSTTNLAPFIRSHFPAHDVGLMDDFWDRSLSFSDLSGTVRTLTFTECTQLGAKMSLVFELVDYCDEVASLVDPNARRHDAWGWSEARLHLPELVSQTESTITRSETDASDEWSARLKATRKDLGLRLKSVVTLLPAASGAFTLTTDKQSTVMGAQLADELYLRVMQMQRSGNYGGNIESSPPSADAPLGKIVIGNASIGGQLDHMDPDVRRFFYRQRQPVVEVDTTWLDVGHVDEVLALVPDQGSAAGFAALRASSGLAMKIIRQAIAKYRSGISPDHPQTIDRSPSGVMERLTIHGKHPVTRLMRGKVWPHEHKPPSDGRPSDILEPPRNYQRLAQALTGGDTRSPSRAMTIYPDFRYVPGPLPTDRAYPADITVLELNYVEQDAELTSVNDFLEDSFQAPIEVVVGDEFTGARLFPLPVVFDRVASTSRWKKNAWAFTTSAFTPDVANLQVVNGHLLIPRPYGPRMKPADVTDVLRNVLTDFSWGSALASKLKPGFYKKFGLDVTTVWIQRQDAVIRFSSSGMADTIYGGINTLSQVADCFRDGFPGLKTAEIERRILTENPRNFTPDGGLREGWRKFVIQEVLVDLFEAYIQLVVNSLGLKVDWVDSWFYHVHFGGIHCGTNVIREPAAGQLPAWWKS